MRILGFEPRMRFLSWSSGLQMYTISIISAYYNIVLKTILHNASDEIWTRILSGYFLRVLCIPFHHTSLLNFDNTVLNTTLSSAGSKIRTCTALFFSQINLNDSCLPFHHTCIRVNIENWTRIFWFTVRCNRHYTISTILFIFILL